MNILIAGYKGFVGKRLCEILADAGHNVWKFTRGESLRYGPICHADLVINAAGQLRDEDKMVDENLVFAVQFANACHVFGKRLIHVSSIAERTNQKRYGATKKAASDVILNFARDSFSKFCVVSPATVFGPDDHNDSFMSRIWEAYELNTKLKVTEEGRDWVYIDDLCRAILIVAEADPSVTSGQVLEVGYGKSRQNSSIVYHFELILGRSISHEIVGQTGNHWYADTVGIHDFGWSPKVTMKDGIRLFIDHKFVAGRSWLGAEA